MACIADVIKPRLVTFAKQRRYLCSGAPNGFNELPVTFQIPLHLDWTQLSTGNAFQITLHLDWTQLSTGNAFQIFLQPYWQISYQANHGPYSNPGTQVGAQIKDFSAVSQTDLTRS